MNPPSSPQPSTPDTRVYHSETLTYGSYLKIPELLSLQRPKTSHHDELLFIQAHQVYELWFKQTLHELAGPGGVCEHLDRDEPLRAAQLLERIHRVVNLLIEQLPLIETMFSTEFAKFRDALRPASGFQSVQFRKLEFLCGNKNEKMLALAGPDEAARAELADYLKRPTPYDHFVRHLSREDDKVFNIPPGALARDTSRPHEEDPALITALHTLYTLNDRPRADGGRGGGERYYAQVKVAEQLLELDERFQVWRFGHVKMVERMIGRRTGTGGSSGAAYLASTIRPFWPDLWAVRDRFGGVGNKE